MADTEQEFFVSPSKRQKIAHSRTFETDIFSKTDGEFNHYPSVEKLAHYDQSFGVNGSFISEKGLEENRNLNDLRVPPIEGELGQGAGGRSEDQLLVTGNGVGPASVDDMLPQFPDRMTDISQIEPSCSHYQTENDPGFLSPAFADIDDLSDEDDSDDSLSGLRLGSWKPSLEPGSIRWVEKQMILGANPRNLLTKLLPQSTMVPPDLDNFTMWKIIINILSEPPRRKKLTYINTFDDVLHLLRTRSNIVVLTGAGVSVSCGIPDFRSRDGIYARLAIDFPDLPDPQAMFDIGYFEKNPRPFFKFAKEIYPGQFQPSISHKFMSLLEKHNKLLRNYTQNIDTLEQVAGITKVIQCHGSFNTASCTKCKYQVNAEAIRQDVFNQIVPLCPKCNLPEDSKQLAVMKPDIVFFGEGLPQRFHHQIDKDREEVDLLIVIGSSLKVRPVALIPNSIPSDVPQILINREPLSHVSFDVELLGDCDVIINELCHKLGDGWNHLCTTEKAQSETKDLPKLYATLPTPPYLPSLLADIEGKDMNDKKQTETEQEQRKLPSSTDLIRSDNSDNDCKDSSKSVISTDSAVVLTDPEDEAPADSAVVDRSRSALSDNIDNSSLKSSEVDSIDTCMLTRSEDSGMFDSPQCVNSEVSDTAQEEKTSDYLKNEKISNNSVAVTDNHRPEVDEENSMPSTESQSSSWYQYSIAQYLTSKKHLSSYTSQSIRLQWSRSVS
uniref:NAD-dependent protein deacetylase sirtuin-1-like isoform X2 n=1 Tax=Saccoglossus kowalevskii TaxID=10224 RepID=A0ABM0MVK5_SACKO|nr:PREDICTED: NAD-dependent protein deacetylase sirtuin-1-like isoform X2 [Saccoglossus kowalevskii]